MEKIPETASDISPYATSNLQQPPPNRTGTNTLGRKETLRLTDYHRQGDTLRIRQQVKSFLNAVFDEQGQLNKCLVNYLLFNKETI